MNVLVTEGSGFVGGAAVRGLLAEGHRVHAMSRSEKSSDLIRTLGAVPVRCDVIPAAQMITQAAVAVTWGTTIVCSHPHRRRGLRPLSRCVRRIHH
jgi:uncharacterized protein YbjT (DUF2867 family)